MAVNPSPLGAVREAQDLSPGIRNLQLAFQEGLLSTEEITNALQLGSSKRQVARAQNLAALPLIPLQAQASAQQLNQQIEQFPAQSKLADLQMQGATRQAEAALAIQPDFTRLQQLQAQEKLAEAEGLLGSQPFASTDSALAFFQRTRPNEKIPQDAKTIALKNREAFSAIQNFKSEVSRLTGQARTESFTTVDPETFNKHRVRVSFDAAGNEIGREDLGVVDVGDKALTEQQANAVQYSARMKQAQANIDALEQAGYDPAKFTNFGQQIAARLNLGVLSSPESQQYEAAKRNWIAAVLRKESGAAISQSEYRGAEHQYFPQPGDAPGTLAQKRTLRETALGTMQAAGLFGLPPAQQAQVKDRFGQIAQPSLGEIKTKHAVKPDSEVDEDTPPVEQAPRQVAPPAPQVPAAPAPVVVKSAADARALPPTVQFFQAPDGRIFKNPNFR